MPPSVFVFTLDCLRAATVNKNNTPFISSLPIKWSRCYSSGTWTLPSHASLFTGECPIEHDVTRPGDKLQRQDAQLPRIAQQSGYETTIFSENPTFSSQTGFGHYVDNVYDDVHKKILKSQFSPFGEMSQVSLSESLSLFKSILNRPNRVRNLTNSVYAAWLQFFDLPRPYPHHGKRLFSYLSSHLSTCHNPQFIISNVLEPHNPYHGAPPNINSKRKPQELKALRAGDDNRTFLLMDDDIPNLVKSFYGDWDKFFTAQKQVYNEYAQEADNLLEIWREKESQILEDALVVIIGDHGQLFGAEGMVGHHTSLHPYGIHVPFYIKPPKNWDNTPRTIDSPVTTAGIGCALMEVCSGNIGNTNKFIESTIKNSLEYENTAISCVDGPTWTMNKLMENDQFEPRLIDKLAVRKVACISDDEFDVYESKWDSDTIFHKKYVYSKNDRKIIRTSDNSPDLLPVERWLQESYDFSSEKRESVDSQLKALGYM